MLANAPGPTLFRTAELRRNEELRWAHERRLHRLLASRQYGALDPLRNGIGRLLIRAGQRLDASESGAAERSPAATAQ